MGMLAPTSIATQESGPLPDTAVLDTDRDGDACDHTPSGEPAVRITSASPDLPAPQSGPAPGAVTIAIRADQAEVIAGDTIGFTITLTNTGAVDATQVGFTGDLPAIEGQSWSVDDPGSLPQGVDCAISDGTLTCDGITLTALTGTLTVAVTAPIGLESCVDAPTYTNSQAELIAPYAGASAAASVAVSCAAEQHCILVALAEGSDGPLRPRIRPQGGPHHQRAGYQRQ